MDEQTVIDTALGYIHCSKYISYFLTPRKVLNIRRVSVGRIDVGNARNDIIKFPNAVQLRIKKSSMHSLIYLKMSAFYLNESA